MIERTKIKKLNIELTDEQKEMENKFIESAVINTDIHIQEYLKLPQSMNGRYICSDLFKETFTEYKKDLESRKKYASIVHNSSAVLANELFQSMVKNDNIHSCIFLSGVPGGGKSFLIQSLNMANLIPNDTMIYEGDITSLTIFDKMKLVVQNNKTIEILIVNPTLELAMINAIKRSFEQGRGASCHTMARIISEIPNTIKKIFIDFPNHVSLGIYNKKTNFDIETLHGLENINLLEHGSYEDVKEKLENIRLNILNERDNTYEFIKTVNGKC